MIKEIVEANCTEDVEKIALIFAGEPEIKVKYLLSLIRPRIVESEMGGNIYDALVSAIMQRKAEIERQGAPSHRRN